MSLKPYPAYKDSGVASLGMVPEHWQVQRLKRLAEIQNGSDYKHIETSGEGYPVIGSGGPFTLASQYMFNGESVLLGRKGTVDKPLYINGPFWAVDTMFYTTIKPNNFAKYLYYCALTIRFNLYSTSTALPSMTQTDLAYIQFAVPQYTEQAAIAAFLDRETGKVDELIAEQEKLIALLAEKRQATISYAVTKGLNPDVPMKDSGVEWLGQIPGHWSVSQLKYLVSLKSGGTPSKDNLAFWDGEIPWASAKDLKTEQLSDTIDHITQAAIQTGGASLVRAGSVLVVVRGMILARMFPVTETLVPMAINQDLKALEPSERVHTTYLSWLLRGSADESLRRLDEAGHGTKALRMESWTAMILPVPPLLEQIEIVHFIEIELAKLDELNTQAVRIIDLLKERRMALISAAVTGKIDVRASAEIITFPISRSRTRGLIATEIIEKLSGRRTFGRVMLQKAAYLAETLAGVSELHGHYLREAAGPLDRDMIEDMEQEANVISGIVVSQPGGAGTAVAYRLSSHPGRHADELTGLLGPERKAKLQFIIDKFLHLDTATAEAVATLFAVWNDFLIGGLAPSDDDIIDGFLNHWHPEKAEKFTPSELLLRLDWMRRNGLVPTGAGPKTETGRLFV